MKFDVVDPSEEQAILDDEDAPGAEADQHPPQDGAGDGTADAPGVHPRLARASERMHARLTTDLTSLGESLRSLHEHIEVARARDAGDAPGAPPPTNFRAGAFTRPRDTPTP